MDSSQKRERDRKQRERRKEKETRRKERAEQKLQRLTMPEGVAPSAEEGATAPPIEGEPPPESQN